MVWISNLTSTVGEQLAFELSNVGAKLVISGLDDRLHAIKKQCLLRNSKIKEDNILIIQPFIATEYSKHEEIVNQVVKHFKKVNKFSFKLPGFINVISSLDKHIHKHECETTQKTV